MPSFAKTTSNHEDRLGKKLVPDFNRPFEIAFLDRGIDKKYADAIL